MGRLLHNTKYNKIKILHELSCLAWFIDKHAKPEAKNADDKDCEQLLENLYNDLKKYIDQIEQLACK